MKDSTSLVATDRGHSPLLDDNPNKCSVQSLRRCVYFQQYVMIGILSAWYVLLLSASVDVLSVAKMALSPMHDALLQIRLGEAKRRPFENCLGTPMERRTLAAMGDEATRNDWMDMTKCMMERESRLEGHYVLHVSKSGGTSLCNLFKSECRPPPESNNCFESHELHMGPMWVRREKATRLGLPRWMMLESAASVKSPSCEKVESFMKLEGINIIMSENSLPNDGICANTFLETIVVRNPMERLASHYNHIFDKCSIDKCKDMLLPSPRGSDARVFNVSFMVENFDVISDNYYTRSLNTHRVFASPFGFGGVNKEEALSTALQSLANFDWILTIGAEDNLAESKNNDFLLLEGLGLSAGLGKSNVRNKVKGSHFTPEGEQQLRDLNTLDNKIWSEAQKLHNLDVESLRKLSQFGGKRRFDAAYPDGSLDNNCCGKICLPKLTIQNN